MLLCVDVSYVAVRNRGGDKREREKERDGALGAFGKGQLFS